MNNVDILLRFRDGGLEITGWGMWWALCYAAWIGILSKDDNR